MKKVFLVAVFAVAVFVGQALAQPYCHWPANEYNDNTCYCGVVQGEPANAANCTEEHGTIVTTCTGACPMVSGSYCYWAANEYNNNTAYCGLVQGGPANAANCTEDSGEIVSCCDGNAPGAGCGGGSTPVIDGLTTINLDVLVQASNLHISSAREATMQLFDMSGKQVFSQKVPSGYSVVNLKDQKMGVYFAVVTSGSHKQTVKVTLK